MPNARGEQVQSAGTHWLSVGERRQLQEGKVVSLPTAGITFQLLGEGCRVSPACPVFRFCACWSLLLAVPVGDSGLFRECFSVTFEADLRSDLKGTDPRTD